MNRKIQIAAHLLLPTGAFAITKVQDRTYVIPAWQEVPNGTTYDDIQVIGQRTVVPIQQPRTISITGSKGNEYTVTFDTFGRANCTCIGFSYHRTCKHIKQASIIK